VIRFTDCKRIRLSADTEIKPFDCDDADLNEFLFTDAKHYLSQLLAVTYLYEYGAETVAFFSVSNDTISFNERTLSKTEWNRLRRTYPNRKRLNKLPSVKIGRLGVDKKYQGADIGTQLLDYIKILFIDNNKTGCRYITVDAYNNAKTISFYKKNGFSFLTENDKDEQTRLMKFDLKWFIGGIVKSA
jgi:GNAT superfamily N-acetyltransferase